MTDLKRPEKAEILKHINDQIVSLNKYLFHLCSAQQTVAKLSRIWFRSEGIQPK